MPINLIVNGVGYSYPVSGDDGWAEGATNWANAVTQNLTSLNTVLASVSSGIFSLANGAVGTPSLRFSNSPTTGLYRVSPNVLGFTSNGVNSGQLSASGGWTLGVSGDTTTSHQFNGITKVQGLSLTLNGVGTSNSVAVIQTGSTSDQMVVTANTGFGAGGELSLYGPDHLTLANYIKFSNNGTFTGEVDSSGKWTLGAAAGSQTHAVNGNLSATGTLAGSNLSGSNTGDITLGSFGSSPSANGASLSGQVLTIQPADSTHPGSVSTGAQTLAGAKTFTDDLSVNSNNIVLDADATGGQNTALLQGTSTNRLALSANSAQGNGGEIFLYGPNHGVDPQTIRFATAGNFVGTVSGTNGNWEIGRNTSTTIRFNCGTASTATSGSNGAVPAQVALYGILNFNGTSYKVPLFNT
jgi:hypothetical protein